MEEIKSPVDQKQELKKTKYEAQGQMRCNG